MGMTFKAPNALRKIERIRVALAMQPMSVNELAPVVFMEPKSIHLYVRFLLDEGIIKVASRGKNFNIYDLA